jgi:lipopolysaccharide export LptBFGC system permease protein LptF
VGLAGVPTNDLLRRMHTDPPPYDRRARAEFHSRVATALAPIALVLLALGAGLHVPRHARLAGLGVGLPVMAAFLSVHLAGAQWSEDWLPPAIGPYLADGAGALCGAVLILLHMRR